MNETAKITSEQRGDTTVIIANKAAIERYGFLQVKVGLRLEVKTGMKHSRNAVVNGAKAILQRHNIVPKRTKAALLAQIEALQGVLYPELPATNAIPA